MEERIDWLDSTRALAIILVVIGHVFGGYTGKYSVPEYQSFIDAVITIIYTFHMPLFFLISGYAYSLKKRNWNAANYKSYVAIKAKQLMIPYFVFDTLQTLVKLSLQGKISSKVTWIDLISLPIKPVDEYWFIYILFLIFCLNAFIEWKIQKESFVIPILLYVLYIILLYNGGSFINKWLILFLNTSKYYIYFYIGKQLYKKSININKGLLILSAIIFAPLVYLSLNVKLNVLETVVINLLLSLSGSFAVIASCKTFKYISKSKMLHYIGQRTMPIYIIHVPLCAVIRVLLLKIGIENLFVSLIIGIVFSIYIPISVYEVWGILWPQQGKQRYKITGQ